MPTVFERIDLITSLALYPESCQPELTKLENRNTEFFKSSKVSLHTLDEVSPTLFLRIQAAADYYTMNQTLMENVPPVFVDIILDPYIFNVFPQSLVPTAAYVLLLAIGSWYLSEHIGGWIHRLAREDASLNRKTK
jgi:hypothetical protein